ncbi:MAG: hypothetical protein U0800_07300 [Isosphaeraceae bacterium]
MSSTRVSLDPSGEIRVALGVDDFELARQLGHERTAEAARSNRPGRAGCRPGNLEQDIDGAAAEVAFARALGLAPSMSISPDPGPDVGDYHVRSTSWPNGRLIVRPGEGGDHLYVLVVGRGREWRVIGTIVGGDALKPEFWAAPNGRPGCYMVPQSRLNRLRIPSIPGATAWPQDSGRSREPRVGGQD